MRTLLAAASLIALAASQFVTPDGCFEAIRNCGVRNSAPYLVTSAASQQACLDQCRADARCVGAQFNQFALAGLSNCRLYNVVPGTRYPYVPSYPNNIGTFGGFNNFGNGFYGGRGNGFNNYGGRGGFNQGRGGRGGGFNEYRSGRGQRGRGQYFRSLPMSDLGNVEVKPLSKNETLAKMLKSLFAKGTPKPTGEKAPADGKGKLVIPEEAPPVKGAALSPADIKEVMKNMKKENQTLSLSDPILARHYRGRQGTYFYQNRGNVIYRWTGACTRTGATIAPVTAPPLNPSTPIPVTYPPITNPPITYPVITTVRLRPTTPLTPAPTPPLPARVQCAEGEVPKFLKLENTELVGLDDFTFTAGSVGACQAACMNNALPDGTQAPCSSFDYDRTTGVCALSIESLPPAGTGTSTQSPNKDYYEKVCLPSTLVQGCSDVLEQIPGMILVGYAAGVTTETSYANCIKSCLNSQQLFGFKCLSGQFFSESTEQNCVLNEESKNTVPDLVNFNGNERVNYFDFQCQNRRSPLGEPMKRGQKGNIVEPGRETWGPWSYCNRVTLQVTRYRNCLSHNPGSCQTETMPCNQRAR